MIRRSVRPGAGGRGGQVGRKVAGAMGNAGGLMGAADRSDVLGRRAEDAGEGGKVGHLPTEVTLADDGHRVVAESGTTAAREELCVGEGHQAAMPERARKSDCQAEYGT